jgi:hypothetical protein
MAVIVDWPENEKAGRETMSHRCLTSLPGKPRTANDAAIMS